LDRPKEKPRRFERARCPLSGWAIRHEIILPSATVYNSFLCRLSLCHSIETRCNSLRTFAKIFLMCLRPSLTADERESARSEVRHAGADERLFVGLSNPTLYYYETFFPRKKRFPVINSCNHSQNQENEKLRHRRCKFWLRRA